MDLLRSKGLACFVLGAAILCSVDARVFAQGQDSQPWDRDVMVMAELLPGRYDNWNQNYFDGRRKLPEAERHERLHTQVARIQAPAFGARAFYAEDYRDNDPAKVVRRRIFTFEPDNDARAVRMRTYWIDDAVASRYATALRDPSSLTERAPTELRYQSGCDVFWSREVGQFAGSSGADCRFKSAVFGEVSAQYRYQLAPGGFWLFEAQRDRRAKLLVGHPSGKPYELQRAREFHCNADIPGVGGGAAIPFERYTGLDLHDKGGVVWFKTREAKPRELGLTLSSVNWPINNETGAFTRNSLVLYVNERVDGVEKSLAYSGTQPDVERLFINLKWMLVNCYRQWNRDVRPEF